MGSWADRKGNLLDVESRESVCLVSQAKKNAFLLMYHLALNIMGVLDIVQTSQTSLKWEVKGKTGTGHQDSHGCTKQRVNIFSYHYFRTK